MAKDETSRIELVLIGIFLTGLGFYLIILLPKLAPIVGVPAIIGMWVVYRILVYGQLTNRKKEERVQEPKKELNAGRAEKRVQEPNELTSGRAVFYVGLLIFFGSLILGVIVAALGNSGVSTLILLFFIFFVGTPLILVGSYLLREERKEKQKLIASSPKQQYCCKNCGALVLQDQQYYPTCGRQLERH